MRIFRIGQSERDPLEVLDWRIKTQIAYFDVCLICGEEENIEMHHVKHLKKDGPKGNSFTSIMSQLNRKQIPVCRECHHKIHEGRYNGVSLGELRKIHEIKREIVKNLPR